MSTDRFELGATFSPDGKTIYFSIIGDGFETSEIVASSHRGGRWSAPEPVAFAGEFRDLDAFVSPDGTKMFFQSDRPTDGTEAKDWDIWVSDATADGWGEPRNLGAPVNTAATETFPVVTATGALFFSSDRPGSNGVDVYRAELLGERYGAPEKLPGPINTAADDSNATVSADEGVMVLSSTRGAEHRGNGDLYVSRRRGGAWSQPVHLGDINTAAREFAPSLSPDARELFFTSNRPTKGATSPRLGDIYKVELPSDH